MSTKEDNKLAKAKAKPKKAKPAANQPYWFNQPNPIDRFTGWLVAWTCCLSVATFGLIAVAILQWRELHWTDETLRQTLFISQRAWIVGGSLTVVGIPKVGEKLDVKITYSNTGNGPAVNLRSFYLPRIVEPPVPDRPTMAGENLACTKAVFEFGETAIFPRANSLINTHTIPGNFITADVMSGKKSLALQGCFVYETMKEIHQTKFCLVIFGDADTTSEERTTLCGDGQWAD